MGSVVREVANVVATKVETKFTFKIRRDKFYV